MSVLFAHLQKKTLNTTTPFVTQYTYESGKKADGTTTLANSINNNGNLLWYAYSDSGNIDVFKESDGKWNHYFYDSLNQLVYEEDSRTNTHTEYVYDKGGNILSKTSYVNCQHFFRQLFQG